MSKNAIIGLIHLFGDNAFKSAFFMHAFEEHVNDEGVVFKPDLNVWYRLKPTALNEVDKLDEPKEIKEKIRKNIAKYIGQPLFHIGKRADNIVVSGLAFSSLVGFDEKCFYKIKSQDHINGLKKAFLCTTTWDEFTKPLIYTIRAFELDKCQSFPDIVVKQSEDEED